MKNSIPSSTAIRSMKIEQLKNLAISMSVEIDPAEKKWVILETLLAKVAQIRHENDSEVVLTQEQQQIVDNSAFNRSEKIRSLWASGMKLTQISRTLDAHYSFVHGVVEKLKLTQQLQTLTQIATEALSNNEPVVIIEESPVVTETVIESPVVVEKIIEKVSKKKSRKNELAA